MKKRISELKSSITHISQITQTKLRKNPDKAGNISTENFHESNVRRLSAIHVHEPSGDKFRVPETTTIGYQESEYQFSGGSPNAHNIPLPDTSYNSNRLSGPTQRSSHGPDTGQEGYEPYRSEAPDQSRFTQPTRQTAIKTAQSIGFDGSGLESSTHGLPIRSSQTTPSADERIKLKWEGTAGVRPALELPENNTQPGEIQQPRRESLINETANRPSSDPATDISNSPNLPPVNVSSERAAPRRMPLVTNQSNTDMSLARTGQESNGPGMGDALAAARVATHNDHVRNNAASTPSMRFNIGNQETWLSKDRTASSLAPSPLPRMPQQNQIISPEQVNLQVVSMNSSTNLPNSGDPRAHWRQDTNSIRDQTSHLEDNSDAEHDIAQSKDQHNSLPVDSASVVPWIPPHSGEGGISNRARKLFSKSSESRGVIDGPHHAYNASVYDKKRADKRIKNLLKQYNITEFHEGVDDWLTTLLLWVPHELRRKENESVSQIDGHIRVANQRNAKIMQLESELKKQKDEQGKLRKRARDGEEAESQLQTKTQDIANLNRLLTQERDLAKEYQIQLGQASKEINQVHRDIEWYKVEYEKLKTHFDHNREKLAAANEDIAAKGQYIGELRQTYAKLEQDKCELQQQHQATIDKAKARENELQQQHQATIDIAKARENELQVNMDNKIAKLRGEFKSAEAARVAQIKDIQSGVESRIANETRRLTKEVESQNKRIAGYSKENYTAISDSHFTLSLQTLAQQVSNLNIYVPRPDFTIDESLDPTNYLGRNSQQGGRNWPKYIRSVCWSIILEGLFQFPLGFGSLGNQGEGCELLFDQYQLFARASPDGMLFPYTY
jgi:hypothetical protein